MEIQEGDVILYQSLNGGEIQINDGIIAMNGGLQTSVYLSLFGGNDNEDVQWWGNTGEEENSKLISETQILLNSISLTTFNLRRVEEAAKRDLQWLLNEKIATSLEVEASIPSLNMLKLVIDINNERFEFMENWRRN